MYHYHFLVYKLELLRSDLMRIPKKAMSASCSAHFSSCPSSRHQFPVPVVADFAFPVPPPADPPFSKRQQFPSKEIPSNILKLKFSCESSQSIIHKISSQSSSEKAPQRTLASERSQAQMPAINTPKKCFGPLRTILR